MFHQIHFAIHLPTNEVEIFGTKYVPATNYRGSRFTYGKTNLSLEKLEKFKTVSWANECPGCGQDNQLQFRLGDQWRVLSQYEALSLLKPQPVFTAMFKTGFYDEEKDVLCYAGHSKAGAEIVLNSNTFRYGYISQWEDGKGKLVKEYDGTEE